MSAQNNLLDLMTQITNLEANISSIIMEFASKLSSLTDLHMLLVLENRDGRKLCGNPHLVESYANGSFRSSEADLLVDVESKTQRSLHSVVNSSYVVDDLVILDEDSSPTTDSYSNSVVNSTATVLTEAVDVKPNLKRKSDNSTSIPDYGKKTRSGVGVFSVNQPRHNSSSPENQMICITDDDHTEDHTSPTSRRFQEHLFRSEDDDALLIDFAELSLPQMKIDFLQNVDNPLALFEKGSVEFRLMNSLLYDFGKSLAYASPYPPETAESKLFFFQNLQKFIDMFPCFKSDLIANIKIEGKTPLANLRMNARAGFKRAVLQRKRLMEK